ncbi:MAG: DNA-binding response regulator [Candidatus Rokuibacteriota bacterium]|nr:MAG: DNA-binding response regulator [Candidatus Rokubacteria bacterium]
MTTVLIVAPTAIARGKLAAVVGASKTLSPVVGAADLSLPEHVEAAQYDVLLVDLGSERAAAWLRNLGAEPVPPAIVLLTEEARRPLGAEALRAGVRAVLPRHASGEEIIAAIEAAAAGLIVIHPDTVGALQPGPSASTRAGVVIARQPLTPREIEVLGMIAEGLGNKIIAARLGISEHTVKFHIASIFVKLNARSRTEAVTIGVRQGLLMI